MRGDPASSVLGWLAAPSQLPEPASPLLRVAGVAGLLAGALLIFWWLRQSRARLERSAPPVPGQIDAEWLERHLFSLTPELVGALYDRRIAWPEVAALVARMSAESKLASRVATGAQGWSNLELWLLVDRQELTGYERELVEGLFFAHRTTSGDAVQDRYRSVGFDPAGILRRHLKESCDALLGTRPVLTWPLGLGLALSAVGLLVSLGWGASILVVAIAVLLGALGPLSFSRLAARRRRDPLRSGPETWPVVASAAVNVVSLALLIAAWPSLAALDVVVFAGWGLMGVALAARIVASRESASGLALRRNLLAARQFFAAELERPEPRLQDEWLAYLIALDLKGAVDHWYLAHGRLETAARRERLAKAHAGDAEPIASAWTGGAGAFGGVGPSGAWIAATSGLTVTVPGRRRPFLPRELGYV